MRKMTSTGGLLCAAALLALASSVTTAQTAANYPGKPVRLIVPFAPGGGTTTTSRIYTDSLSKDLGQPFVVDNRPGANTTIGTQAVARSAPDGYTLLLGTNSIALNPWTQANLPYDTLKDLGGVATLIRNADMIAVHPSVPANNLKELVAYAKQNPGKINAIISGVATSSHVSLILFMQAADIKFTLVPYKGSGPALSDFLSGKVQLFMSTPANFIAHVKAGKLKGIVIGGDKRNPAVPGIPTFAEAGLATYDGNNAWHLLLAPAATPRDIFEKLNASVRKAQAAPDIREMHAKAGIEPFSSSLAATNTFIRAEMESYGKVIKEHNIKPEED